MHCSGLVITMVVSLVFILLLRYTAKVLLWLIIYAVVIAVGFGERRPRFVYTGLSPPSPCEALQLSWQTAADLDGAHSPRCSASQVSGTATGSTPR